MGVEFDEDVATSRSVIWVPCKGKIFDSSLIAPWHGFVWMNPPYGGRNGIRPWLEKFVEHGNGVCLVPDRTSAPWWQYIACASDAVLFVSPKIQFLRPSGKPGPSPANGSTLIAIGKKGVKALERGCANGLGISWCV